MTRWSAILEEVAGSLDISPTKYREAVGHYEAVGRWLDDELSPLRKFRPQIYPQGSFALGTVVRPVRGGKIVDYDIDLVCELLVRPEDSDPGRFKALLGDRLKAHGKYAELLDPEGRRCWTLNYAEADGIGFHLDALPAALAHRSDRVQLALDGVHESFAGRAISLTEKDKRSGAYAWLMGGSNPRGFAAWFASRMEASFRGLATLQKREIARRNPLVFARVEDVPDALVRTPLQRAVQLLKRHRDARFAGHETEGEKPISMIITTIAALAYRGEPTVDAALAGVLAQIDSFVTREDDKWKVANPVNPRENFADRWNQPGSKRADAFFEWVNWLRQDLGLLDEAGSEAEARGLLEEALAVKGGGTPLRSGSALVVANPVPPLADVSHRQAPPWPVALRNRVEVAGTVHRGRNPSKTLAQLRGQPVPKRQQLRFQARTDALPPYQVKWQVVNTGAEARAAGSYQMRGGFDDGEANSQHGSVRWEDTAYRGTHTIEAFVVKDGKCVARSGPVRVRVA